MGRSLSKRLSSPAQIIESIDAATLFNSATEVEDHMQEVRYGLLGALDCSLRAIIENKATPEEVGAMWHISAYKEAPSPPKEVTETMPIDVNAIRTSEDPVERRAFYKMKARATEIFTFVATHPEPNRGAKEVGAQMGLPLCEGASQTAAAEAHAVSRATFSHGVRRFQCRSNSAFTGSPYQKDDHLREVYRDARNDYLDSQNHEPTLECHNHTSDFGGSDSID